MIHFEILPIALQSARKTKSKELEDNRPFRFILFFWFTTKRCQIFQIILFIANISQEIGF